MKDQHFTPEDNWEQWFKHFKPICDSDVKDNTSDINLYIKEHTSPMEDLRKVWTVVEGERDTLWLCPGYHIVNKQGFITTEVPWVDEQGDIDISHMISTGVAFYSCKEFIEETLYQELTDEQEEELQQILF